MRHTMGSALCLALMLILAGCFLAPERRERIAQEATANATVTKAAATVAAIASLPPAERAVAEATATAEAPTSTPLPPTATPTPDVQIMIATKEAHRKATQEAVIASGNLQELVVGNWWGQLDVGFFNYIEFYPDGTWAARIDARQYREGSIPQIFRGTYVIEAPSVAEVRIYLENEDLTRVACSLLFSEGVVTAESTEWYALSTMIFKCYSGYAGSDAPFAQCGEDALSKKSVWCTEGLLYQLETPEATATTSEEERLRAPIVGAWIVEAISQHYAYIEFYQDGTYAARLYPKEEYLARKDEVIRGTYKMLPEEKIRLKDEVLGEVEYRLHWQEGTSGQGKSYQILQIVPEDIFDRQIFMRCEDAIEIQTQWMGWCVEGLNYQW